MDAEARNKAEARRQKILARQKDRLSAITGAYAEPTVQQQTPIVTVDGPAQRSGTKIASAAPSAEQCGAAVVQQQQQQAAQQVYEQLAAAAIHLQRAQAEFSAANAGNQQLQQDVQHSFENEVAGRPDAQGEPGTCGGAAAQGEQSQIQQHSERLAWVLKLGPALSTAVKQTQVVRLLSALLLAYAMLSGWPLGIPPAVLVLIMDTLIIASAVAVLSSTSYGRRLAAADAALTAGHRDVRVPMRLRSFDIISLLPGLKELINVLSGYKQFANALSEDVAVYTVGLGLLTVVISTLPV